MDSWTSCLIPARPVASDIFDVQRFRNVYLVQPDKLNASAEIPGEGGWQWRLRQAFSDLQIGYAGLLDENPEVSTSSFLGSFHDRRIALGKRSWGENDHQGHPWMWSPGIAPVPATSRALGCELPGVDSKFERRVVALVLVSVRFGKSRHGAVETVTAAEVTCDCRRITGAGVCPG